MMDILEKEFTSLFFLTMRKFDLSVSLQSCSEGSGILKKETLV